MITMVCWVPWLCSPKSETSLKISHIRRFQWHRCDASGLKRLPVPWNTERLTGRGHLLGDIEVHIDIEWNIMTTAKYDNISFNSKTLYEESFLANLSNNDCLYILLPLCSYRPRHHNNVNSCSATTRARRESETTTTIPESTINNSAKKDQEKPSSNSQPMIQQTTIRININQQFFK